MAVEVFNRYEDKYIIDKETFKRIVRTLEIYMDKDKYNEENQFYPISNIYYDTKDYKLIRTSLQKPKFKEKLRLRSYGMANNDTKVFLEIKKKYHGLVNKRRTKITLNEADVFLKSGIKPDIKTYMNPQVVNELEYFINRCELEPKAYISYDRMAFFSKGESDLRISFDANIRGREYDLSLKKPALGEFVLEDEKYVMEIKTRYAMPLWLVHLLCEEKVYRTSFSKYGRFYKSMLKEERQDNCGMKVSQLSM